MEVSIDIKELRERKIFVATPMYGGMCGGQYTKSTADLATMCTKYGVELSFFYLIVINKVQLKSIILLLS